MVPAGRDVIAETLYRRRELLNEKILPKLAVPIWQSPELKGRMADLVCPVKTQRLEGLIAKRRNSEYEAGERAGAWQKMRVNQG